MMESRLIILSIIPLDGFLLMLEGVLWILGMFVELQASISLWWSHCLPTILRLLCYRSLTWKRMQPSNNRSDSNIMWWINNICMYSCQKIVDNAFWGPIHPTRQLGAAPAHSTLVHHNTTNRPFQKQTITESFEILLIYIIICLL